MGSVLPRNTEPASRPSANSFLWRKGLSPSTLASTPQSPSSARRSTSLAVATSSLRFTMTNSILNSLPQLSGSVGAWGSLYDVQEPAKKPRHVSTAPPAAATKQPSAYGVKRNLEMCTEALGCETGGFDAAADEVDDGADRKRRAREEETKVVDATEGRVRRRAAGVLPPPLTTLAGGASRMRMVHERRDGRLEVYAVRASGMEAERSGGRLRLRFLPCDGCSAAICGQQEPQQAEEDETEEVDQPHEEECVVAKYMRGGRCVGLEGAAAAAMGGKKWEPEQAAAFWVAT